MKQIVFFEPPYDVKGHKQLISEIGNRIAKDHHFFTGDIAVEFMSDEDLHRVNIEYLDHDFFTDIITFDESTEKELNGHLMISIDRIIDNANKTGNTFVDECLRVIFHGILHLAGYRDKTESEQKIMRAAENKYLNKFHVSRETNEL